MNVILADTGALYAIAARDDAWHDKVSAFLEANTDPIIIPATVIPEVCYLLNRRLGAEAELRFITSVVRGELRVENLVKEDYLRSMELLNQFHTSDIGFVDASIVSVAERLKITRILTSDRKDFSLFRPRHCAAFTLLP